MTDDLPTSPEALLVLFGQLDIPYTLHEHEPVFTVAESEHLNAVIPGMHCRNLFLRDKKKRMYLVVAANETSVDLKALPDAIDSARLSFGSAERLWEYLGVKPGSVCPFAVVNDHEHAVQVVLDSVMMQANLVNYHPMVNSMTVSLTPQDLLRFFDHTGHDVQIVDLPSVVTDRL